MSTNRKTLTCERCGRRSIVGLDPDVRQILFTGGAQALVGNEQAMNTGIREGFVLRPSEHLRDTFLVVCVSCLRKTYLRRSDIEAGGLVCHACRKAPQDNWWSKTYGGHRNPRPPQKIVCPDCGAVRYGPLNVDGRAYALSWACAGFVPDPKQGPRVSLETPHLADVKKCCNYVGQGCIVRAHGRCIVLDGGRCGWYEKAVRPGGRLSGRACAACGGEVLKRRRFCDRCRQARRRSAYRESKRRNRVSCPQLTAPAPLNSQEFEAAQGTF